MSSIKFQNFSVHPNCNFDVSMKDGNTILVFEDGTTATITLDKPRNKISAEEATMTSVIKPTDWKAIREALVQASAPQVGAKAEERIIARNQELRSSAAAVGLPISAVCLSVVSGTERR